MKTTEFQRNELRHLSLVDDALARTIAAVLDDLDESIANFDALLDQFECMADDSDASVFSFLAMANRTNNELHERVALRDGQLTEVLRERDHLRDSLAARDVAISAAAAEVAAMRKERDEANLALVEIRAEVDRSQRCLREAFDSEVHTAARVVDAERTLEAVREELRKVTGERDAAKRDRAVAIQTKDDILLERAAAEDRYDNLRCLVAYLRRRLSEQAATIRGYEQGGDPGRNVTAGLLRVEQERSFALGGEIDRLCARLESTNGLVEGMSETIANQEGEVERLKGALQQQLQIWAEDDYSPAEAGCEMHVVALEALGPDRKPIAKCRTCDGTLAPDGRCTTCEAASGNVLPDGLQPGPLSPEAEEKLAVIRAERLAPIGAILPPPFSPNDFGLNDDEGES